MFFKKTNKVMEFLDKADFYVDKEEYLMAIKYYDKAIKADEKCTYAYCEKAYCLAWVCKYDEALQLFDKAIELDENYARAHFLKGCELSWIKARKRESINCFNKVIEISPDCVDAYYEKADVFFMLGEYGKALETFKQVIQLDENYIEAYRKMLSIFILYDDYKEVFNQLNKIAGLSKNTKALNCKMGIALYCCGEYEESIRYCNKLIAPDGKYALAYLYKIRSLLALGKEDEAFDYALAYLYKIRSLLALGKEDEALEILNTVINFEFCEPMIQKSIAGCLIQLGKIKESKEHFNKAEKLRKIDEHKIQVEAYSKMMKNIKMLH